MIGVGQVLQQALRLHGRRDALLQEDRRIRQEAGICRARQDRKESVEAVLDALEQRFHEKSMGLLETLLTAFLNDVLPRDAADDQKVTMELEHLRGLPALQVQVCQGGLPEDALRGRGGSVANVLSAGLRFIAVARSSGMRGSLLGMRPFLVLDEADCWLSPSRVGDFARVIQQLSRDLGLQVLIISHHDSHLFSGFPIFLSRETGTDGYPSAQVQHPPLMAKKNVETPKGEWAPVREISLRNFLSHEDTVIPLTPGVTVLTGENDVGKSAVTQAIRAVAYNDAGDGMIRHGAEKATITIRFADDTAIQWERVRKGSPKVIYRKLKGDQVEQETPSAREVPEWVTQMLGIRLQDDLDVQVSDQKSPVFLLQESPAKRAQILDIGRESQYLRKMRESWKRQVDEDRRTIRAGEKRLQAVETALSHLQDLPELVEQLTVLERQSQSLQKQQEDLLRRERQWLPCDQAQKRLQAFSLPDSRVVLPAGKEELHRLQAFLPQQTQAARLHKRLRVGIPDASLSRLPDAQTMENLRRLPESIRMAKQILQLQEKRRRLKIPQSLRTECLKEAQGKLQELSGMSGLGQQAAGFLQRLRETRGAEQEARQKLSRIQQQKKSLLGNQENCPVCGGSLPPVHDHPEVA
ncbi:AAA family ATPase [Acidithiobacillus sp. IBUN Pt1247-S3]|uniref:AAA family ATPase n=1 Tax=Acidithiobacillus sp. IBUN Pt1247-S3 TaxID=3166642 RepID=UPI0034E57D40